MIKQLKYFVLFPFLFLLPQALSAFDGINFWQHPEIAGANTVFIDAGAAPLMLEGIFDNFDKYDYLPLEFRAEYFPPFFLPVSFGIFFKTPYPNLKSFGTRAAYHFDIRAPKADLYIVYVSDFGFILNKLLLKYNDTPAPVNFFDFRIGIRYFFGTIGVCVESGFKFESVILSLSIKIN